MQPETPNLKGTRMVKYVSADEIRDSGILHEANRLFFHPLGLALEVRLEDGLLALQDWRDDEEGVEFAPATLDRDKAERFHALVQRRHESRCLRLGYVIQPFARGGAR